ncbi:MAG TPA: tripartite tricarboxylate transporter substrate binding protein [Ramlibacter sp.]|uniref:Bug family tripartite tricarboxylate transporter substrate binding protein n=1 Tax=Ramlibacter sp. TaxID=1917967 RepID=UPI002C0075D1|nr:tripartite tricarboxylate transporter substrate binding protein [Ramlibacter sp.]HVZ45194.1 tripartite tricarboxylate transporter substrate binding protein [Ramlibacter sp.]
MSERRITRRAVLTRGLAVAASLPLAARAEDYPNHTIEIIVPYAPGGSTDAMGRVVAPRLSELLKVPVVVSNRAGAAGAIGTAYGLATSDGYRIVAGGNSNLGPGLISGQRPSYTLDDVTSIARATINPLLLVAKTGRFASFEAFAKEAREKPDTITFSTWGPRSPAHFYGEMIAESVGGKLRHIPYDSGSKAMLAAMGGQVDIAVATAATAKAQINAGTLMGLLVSTESKLPDIPSVESIKALGYPNAVYVSFEGFVTGSKVPADRVAVLRQAFEKILNEPKIKTALADGGAVPSYQSGPDYDRHLRQNLVTLSAVMAKVKMDD